jgi:hypothetical protein
MKRFVLVDMNDTDRFDTELEARARMSEWIDYARKLYRDSRADADAETIARWDAENDFYAQNDDIAGQIRLYSIDLDTYEGDPGAFPEDMLNGCERLETFNYSQFRDE